MVKTFYDPGARIWRPTIESAESVGRQGYTFWCSLLAWQAILEGAKVEPTKWKPKIGPFFDVLEQYFDKRGHAYCAWKFFPGNDDKFYDDNAWAAIACMEAYGITRETRYRSRAIDVFRGFVVGGWDRSGKPGGVRWGTKAGIEDRADRTTSATAAGALAALLIDGKGDRQWAKRALDWIRAKVSAPSGLIVDGFRSPRFQRMDAIWTYNTGVPIRAALEYARRTGDASYRSWAIRMGDACLNRDLCPLFDGSVRDREKRFWYDSTFFLHYLVDGLRGLSRATHELKYLEEARRQGAYIMGRLRDRDGLYWRNMRLWTIGSEQQLAFAEMTGQTLPDLTPDASERSMEPGELAKPVDRRRLVKTLLANAGVARMFWLLSH
jgi:hypothetical protein